VSRRYLINKGEPSMLPGTSSNKVVRGLALFGIVIPSLVGLATGASANPMTPSALGASKAAPSPSLSSDAGWAKTLGAGVVVVPPEHTAAGHGSPGAALQGFVSALDNRQLKLWCSYYEPSFQASCRSNAAGYVAANKPAFKNFALGYVAIDGNRALVGSTGTDCLATGKPKCSSNHNPAAIFATGLTFKALWAKTVTAYSSTANVYSLDLSVKIGGSWYNYVPSS
jgi:hypothetical protein